MTWTDNTSNHKAFKIKADNEKGLTDELVTLFFALKTEDFSDAKQLLIWIDATNGNLFISGFANETNETFDEKGIFVELTELLEENPNAYDFDQIVVSSLKKAHKKAEATTIKRSYELFYQTEDESKAKKL